MFRTFLLLGAALISVNTAQAQASWDLAPRWVCRGDKTLSCDNTATCKNGLSRAFFEIDFAAGTIANLNLPNSPDDRITTRKFTPVTPYEPAGGLKGNSYFVTSAQQAFFIEEKAEDTVLEPSYRLRMITSYSNGDTIHYGTCIPRKKQ